MSTMAVVGALEVGSGLKVATESDRAVRLAPETVQAAFHICAVGPEEERDCARRFLMCSLGLAAGNTTSDSGGDGPEEVDPIVWGNLLEDALNPDDLYSTTRFTAFVVQSLEATAAALLPPGWTGITYSVAPMQRSGVCSAYAWAAGVPDVLLIDSHRNCAIDLTLVNEVSSGEWAGLHVLAGNHCYCLDKLSATVSIVRSI